MRYGVRKDYISHEERIVLDWIGSSILASAADSMLVCNPMSAPIGKDAVGDKSLESVNKLSEGYLSCINSISSKEVR